MVMQSLPVLPMMLPLRMRNQGNHEHLRAQEQYTAFRSTPFTKTKADVASAGRGPGALFRDEWNSMATRAQQKGLSLYKSDRDVCPTVSAAVDAIYTANEVHDLGSQIKKKGNAGTQLKSSTPRFMSTEQEDGDERMRTPRSGRGPGSYSPERFTGAFPVLSDHVTPSSVREEKMKARIEFERAFAIFPSSPRACLNCTMPTELVGSGRLVRHTRALADHGDRNPTIQLPREPSTSEWNGLESAALKPALTPRNAYSGKANRQLILLRGKQ